MMSMRLNWRNWWFSIFTKLLAMFFIVILPVYALAIKMNDSGSQLVRNEISNSLQSQIHFYRTALDQEIDRMIKLQREYVNDNDLLSLSVINEALTDYDRSTFMKGFQYKLDLMKSSGIYVTKASVYIPSLHRIISTDDLSQALSVEVLEQLKQSRENPNNTPLYYKDGSVFIREYFPSRVISPQRDPVFVLETEVSVSQLQQFLQQISSYKHSGAVILTDHWEIASVPNSQEEERIVGSIRTRVTSNTGKGQGIETIQLDKQNYITAYEYSPETKTTMLVYLPESEVLGPLKTYKGFIIIMSIVTAVLIVLVSYWVYLVIHKPLMKLVRAFRKIESGNLTIALHHKSKDEFSYLYQQFNGMTAKLNNLVYEVYEQKLQTQQAELNQLQSQINPHFLYNSLYLLYRMTKAEDYENSLKFTSYLGNYFRYITKKTGDDISLEEEWNHVWMYMEIQNIRFSNRIKVMIDDLPEKLHKLMIPRLILQPLVENAYNYGLENTLVGGELSVNIEGSESELLITIEDNGVGMSETEMDSWNQRFSTHNVKADVSGMINVHRRLQLKFGDESGIRLAPLAGGGLQVFMKIKLMKDQGESYAALDAG